MRLFPGLLAIGATANGIPHYGPTSGDRCLSSRDDETGRYTLHKSNQSYNTILEKCNSKTGQNTTFERFEI